MLCDGLYEQVINKGLDSELVGTDKLSQTAPIDTAEASKVLAKYVAEVVERGLDNLRDNGGDLNAQVALANQIITTIRSSPQFNLKQKKLTSTRSLSRSGRNSFLRFLIGRTAYGPSMRKLRSSVRKHQSHSPAFSPAQFTSRRCTLSSRKKSYPATESTCWFLSSNGAACASSWTS